MTDLAPIASHERHEMLDALRGFALFGIFLANIRFFSGWEFLGAEQRSALAGHSYELFDFLHLAVIDGKFYTLFPSCSGWVSPFSCSGWKGAARPPVRSTCGGR